MDTDNGPSRPGDDDDGDDDTGDGDDDAGDDADDDDDDTGGDDERPSIDSGINPRNDAGPIDAGRVDAGRHDAGDAGASMPTADAALSALDGSLGIDASSSDGSVQDAGADAQADGAAPRADLGKGDGSDVVIVGDSWMDNEPPFVLGTGGGIAAALNRLTRQPYRNYAIQGTMMLKDNALGIAIPKQWDGALRADRDIKTVLMTGGGNDIILDSAAPRDCASGGPQCKAKLEEITRALVLLWNRMGAAGVEDVVHVLYSKNVGDVRDVEPNNESVRQACAAITSTRCHTVNTDQLVRGSQDLVFDGIHPNQATNDRIAKVISDLMVAEGMRR